MKNFEQHFATQITPEVCWAACSQMVLSVQGYSVTQSNILDVFHASPGLFSKANTQTNDFASLEEICRVLERLGKGTDTQPHILATPFEKSLHGSIWDLSEGRPVIACLSTGEGVGHAYVLKGVTVGFYSIGWDILVKPKGFFYALLRGPWTYDPANPGKVYAPGEVDLVSIAGFLPDMNRYREFYFRKDDPFAQSQVCLYDATLADPYPGNNPEITLTGHEFGERIRFLIRVRYKP
ncbi:MAG: hypothetical protein JNL10_00235 [Verrucomicrobiales bacterium]|nr:hypothetical protein [Verrucomicrobiales bacterium]